MPIARKIFIPGTVTTAGDVMKFIDNCYDPDLLRKIQVAAYNRIKGEVTTIKRNNFGIGDPVSFYSRSLGTCYGKIVKVMRQRAVVQTTDDKKWRVPISILQSNR